MSKKAKRRADIISDSRFSIVSVRKEAKPPYMFVKVSVKYVGVKYIGRGFSKVSWPDCYDENHGLARTRALNDVADQIIASGAPW